MARDDCDCDVVSIVRGERRELPQLHAAVSGNREVRVLSSFRVSSSHRERRKSSVIRSRGVRESFVFIWFLSPVVQGNPPSFTDPVKAYSYVLTLPQYM